MSDRNDSGVPPVESARRQQSSPRHRSCTPPPDDRPRLCAGRVWRRRRHVRPTVTRACPPAGRSSILRPAAKTSFKGEHMPRCIKTIAFAFIIFWTWTGAAFADITIGVTLSATGPAASLGIPEKNTIELLPSTIAGQKLNWIVLDDASDTTRAVTNARKLIAEDKVDVIVGSTITPNSLAMIDVVADAETPMISMAASASIVDPTNAKTRWVVKTPQTDALMADAVAVHMK